MSAGSSKQVPLEAIGRCYRRAWQWPGMKNADQETCP
jgi:hypothetical protein